MANWGPVKVNSKEEKIIKEEIFNKQKLNRIWKLTRSPSKSSGSGLFSETLTAALGKRKNRFKEITEELNLRINKEEETEELYEPPLFNVEKIQRIMERVVEKQFEVKDEEEGAKYIYDPALNLKMCQTIAKQIKDRVKAMNYKRLEELVGVFGGWLM
ncbi:conserved hypothetical protein [Culex quinquefasciatus]|uniref:Uncharacterized protein n=1 Tax=Culex quinquefasciatus TaxID=7176 RepID=B0VZW8_CULQU|nr:conserved hypothetical protein [Culex quinquefasciatus]|eukprot:XP_001842002.1 conserved hypothetical protein [Culex quinquefasciatus]